MDVLVIHIDPSMREPGEVSDRKRADEVVVGVQRNVQFSIETFQIMVAASRSFELVQVAGEASCTSESGRSPMHSMYGLCSSSDRSNV